MLQIVAPKSLFDAIVVGSGAMRAVLLEAGRKITHDFLPERLRESRA